jgi:hypothetical protein
VISYSGIAEDFTRFRQLSPAVFEALRVANHAVLAPFVESGVPENSDFHPYLDLGAEKTRFDRSQAGAFIGLGNDRFPLGLVLSGRRSPFGTDLAPAIQINRAEELALGAALRAGVVPPDTGVEHDPLRRARHRLMSLRAQMAAGPPSDWTLWLRDAFAVDLDLHGGSAGVADERFFDELFAYTDKSRAPERVTAGLHFLRAASRWDWPAVDSIGERVLLLGSQPQGLPIGGDIVRDALVVAKIRRGDIKGARRVFDTLISHGSRLRGDLRTRLLRAWVERLEAEEKAAAPAAAGEEPAKSAR